MNRLEFALIGNASLALEAARIIVGRGHSLTSFTVRDPALAAAARAQGLPVGEPAACDYLLSVANLHLVPDAVLALARRGAVNFHDGPLPERAGLNAPVWALLDGAAEHAITWHRIAGGVDEGPVLLRVPVPVAADDTALTLNARCWEAAQRSLPELIEMLEQGRDAGQPQPHAPLRQHMRADRPAAAGMLDLTRDAESQARLVRALDHGPYWNPMLRPRLLTPAGKVLLVGMAEPAARPAGADGAAPGTVLEAGEDRLLIACAGGALELGGLTGQDGQPCPHGLTAGDVIPAPPREPALDETIRRAAKDETHWRARLARLAPLVIPEAAAPKAAPDWTRARIVLPRPQAPGQILAAVTGALARMTGSGAFDIALAPPLPAVARPHLLGFQPLSVETEGETLAALAETLARDLAAAAARGPIMADLVARAPELSRPGVPGLALAADPADAPAGAALCLSLPETPEAEVALWWDRARLPEGAVTALTRISEALAAADPALPLAEAPTLADGQNPRVARNDEGPGEGAPATIHEAFAAAAARPDATALVFRDESLSYAQLDARAGRLARQLAAMGVGPGDPVGLFARRGLGLVIGALAILKAGGAYVPLDPDYPAERLAHYVSDSGAQVVLADPAIAARLPAHGARLLMLDAAGPEAEPRAASGSDLAYLIYTSGSTGTPKGVMVEHRNVINFFAGMDRSLASPEPQTWLAVTSLSFDISVLEIFWTLTRGWKVVIAGDLLASDEAEAAAGPARRQGTQMSLYYWGNDDGAGPRKYEMLLEGAKLAARHGFAAVWTPERHFHAFGGPYPNPSVTGAAVAAVAPGIGVRAGSCVAPLHHPARIAEEWAVIDNLTNGRAGIAFASGWQPDDFVLRPGNTPPANKPAMLDAIDQVRRLWKGEAVGFPRGDGSIHKVVTQPRPVSAELPVWVTTAGNPQTWREAGKLGANVLTHLLGQSIDDIKARIPDYHAALREAGHDPAEFTVTLMLHSYLAETREAAMEAAREPMKDYLRAAAGLVKQYAWAFPAFKKPAGVTDPMAIDLSTLSEDELEGILEFAFLRYFNDSGLFGTVDEAEERIRALRAIGVGEIACLIDYGIPSDMVLEGLERLAALHDRVNPLVQETGDYGIAAQIRRHGVTHLQATPSMARLLLEDAPSRAALAQLKLVALGGEALSPGLLADLRAASGARVLNMYGPTETTIWSAVADLGTSGEDVWLGDPIAGTSLELRDAAGQPVADGIAGELWIGGAGVTRGYWQREAQTATAFPERPEGRRYRTGDLCRWDSTGRLRFLGRVDQQVKLRGYRIELGEIEARLARLPGVREVAVVAQAQGAGERQLAGFVTGENLDGAALRTALSRDLPDFMVPLRITVLQAMPLTPNRKIDRKALAAGDPAAVPLAAPAKPAAAPAPKAATPAPAAPAPAAPAAAGDLQDRIGQVMARILGLPAVQPGDNFFELGGHSLLAVQLHRTIRDELGVTRSSITDIFRFPVMRDLAAHLGRDRQPAAPAPAPAPAVASPEAPAPTAEPASAGPARDLMAERRALRARLRPQGTTQ